MRRTIKGRQIGIRWQFANKLEDLDFADDVALVTSRIVDMREADRAEDYLRKNSGNEMEC